jgi:hypothetical protein
VTAAQQLGAAASAPFFLAPVVLALLVPSRSLRWFRRTRAAHQARQERAIRELATDRAPQPVLPSSRSRVVALR